VAAREKGIEVLVPTAEVEKHGVEAQEGVHLGAEASEPTDMAIVLGGDGSILTALRAYAGRGVPVFALNYGAIGFLATVEPHSIDESLAIAFEGRFELLELPGIAAEVDGNEQWGVNDVSVHRVHAQRVAELGYSIKDDTLGAVRCDGLVASTPVGSTGYNLANGGPILAWGVEGYVVSFIAPHTLTARTLVVAPHDVLRIENLSRREDVDVTTDGRPACTLPPGEHLSVRFAHDRFLLAQIPGTSFYHRFREKFGRLAY
jgi:NAD+ kinase